MGSAESFRSACADSNSFSCRQGCVHSPSNLAHFEEVSYPLEVEGSLALEYIWLLLPAADILNQATIYTSVHVTIYSEGSLSCHPRHLVVCALITEDGHRVIFTMVLYDTQQISNVGGLSFAAKNTCDSVRYRSGWAKTQYL